MVNLKKSGKNPTMITFFCYKTVQKKQFKILCHKGGLCMHGHIILCIIFISGTTSCRKCSKCFYIRVSKYPPNATFRNANKNAQRANVIGSMIWHNVDTPSLTRACILLLGRAEASPPFSVQFAEFSLYLFIYCERSELSDLFSGTDFIF